MGDLRDRRLALVVQRYGLEVNGGSELHCRMVAERLARYFRVEVLTTCAVDYVTWRNHYAPGLGSVAGIPVRRFPVDTPRDSDVFRQVSAEILFQPHTPEQEQEWLQVQGPRCPGLLAHLKASRASYDAFIFFTYLYYPTCLGLPIVHDRALLVPTVHDEPPVYLGIYDSLFRAPRRILFSTPEERDFAERRFCLDSDRGEIVGVGVDPPPGGSDPFWDAFRPRLGSSCVLSYLGRIDESKGCGALVDHFRRYRSDRPARDLKLLLMGRSAMRLPDDPCILRAGFVPELAKHRALEDSRVVLLPSPYESLSLAALEAWAAGRPVLANGGCEVLRGQCRRSNGGLWYNSYEEFRACLDRLLDDEAFSSTLGAQGRSWVLENHSWERVENKFREILAEGVFRAATRP
jgi:glycosyltransferase involved in cell wall biosynthesis